MKCHGILIIAGLVEPGPAVESSAVVATAAALTPWSCSAVAAAGSSGSAQVELA